jgi:hypothetical protein
VCSFSRGPVSTGRANSRSHRRARAPHRRETTGSSASASCGSPRSVLNKCRPIISGAVPTIDFRARRSDGGHTSHHRGGQISARPAARSYAYGDDEVGRGSHADGRERGDREGDGPEANRAPKGFAAGQGRQAGAAIAKGPAQRELAGPRQKPLGFRLRLPRPRTCNRDAKEDA